MRSFFSAPSISALLPVGQDVEDLIDALRDYRLALTYRLLLRRHVGATYPRLGYTLLDGGPDDEFTND